MIYTIINIFQIAGVLMGFLTLLFIARKKHPKPRRYC